MRNTSSFYLSKNIHSNRSVKPNAVHPESLDLGIPQGNARDSLTPLRRRTSIPCYLTIL
jgi:hypothetical protein